VPNNEQQHAAKRRIVAGAALLATYATVVAFVFYDQATSWPHEGSWGSLIFFFLCPGIAFQASSLGWTWLKGRPPARHAWVRVITIPLGLLLAAALATAAGWLALRDFESAYAPFAASVDASLADPCGSAARYFSIPSVTAYSRQTGHQRSAAKLRYDRRRFVLSFAGGSIDVDGSTIYYDSSTRTWSKFHNDDAGRSGAFARLTAGLGECVLQAQ